MSGKAFTYDIPNEWEIEAVAYDRCVVHFRPHTAWKGEDFGFDWVRIEDTNLGGDIMYATNMGRYYTSERVLDKRMNSFNGSVFEKDPKMYEDLLLGYFSYKHEISFKKSNRLPDGNVKDLRYWKKVSKYTYYTSVMTLTVGTKAKLQLIVEVEDRKTPPERIELRGDVNLFSIDSGNLQPRKGNYECEVECIAPLVENEVIKAVAIFVDVDGDEIEYPCGELRVCKNDPPHRIFNILCVNVKLISSRKEFHGKFESAEEQNVRKIFNQAMVTCNIETDELTLDVNAEIVNPNDSNSTPKKVAEILDPTQRTFDKTDNLTYICKWAFLRKKSDELLCSIADCENRYKSYSMLFFFENTGTEREIGTDKDNNPIMGHTAGSTSIGSPLAVILGNSNDSVAHELLHTLGLLHSWNTKDVKTQELGKIESTYKSILDFSDAEREKKMKEYNDYYSYWDYALFTYTGSETDNVLDYFNRSKDNVTWYWQWRLIWNILRERNRT